MRKYGSKLRTPDPLGRHLLVFIKKECRGSDWVTRSLACLHICRLVKEILLVILKNCNLVEFSKCSSIFQMRALSPLYPMSEMFSFNGWSKNIVNIDCGERGLWTIRFSFCQRFLSLVVEYKVDIGKVIIQDLYGLKFF